jgi:hypothetical protein
MTGEVSPGTGAGSGAPPELRASDEDRDRAVEILRVAAGDGRLTAAELDERVEAALTARTSGELTALTADLPAVPRQADSIAAQAKDIVRLDYQGGNATRRGQWVVPARLEIRAVGGTVKLDFTNAVITQSTLQIQAYVRGGRLVLVTKPGIEVDADGITVRGGTVKIRPRNGWKEPVHLTVEVSGENHGGHVTDRPPAAADVPAMASAQAKTTCQVIPRLTSPLPKPCYPDGQAAQALQPRRSALGSAVGGHPADRAARR